MSECHHDKSNLGQNVHESASSGYWSEQYAIQGESPVKLENVDFRDCKNKIL